MRKKVLSMSYINYIKIMAYLDIIEVELNKIALAVGHESYDEFIANKKINGV